MKKAHAKRPATKPISDDEILPEYDISKSQPNKYALRYKPGSVVVVLDPDVATTFGNSKEANEALRALAGIIQSRGPRRTPEKRARR